VKEEMRFLKYRWDVVSAWPDSHRKTVFLDAIESRLRTYRTEAPEVLAASQTRSTRLPVSN